MPEGRIQAPTHLTERTVWQPRWPTHPNGAIGLVDIVIAETDAEEAPVGSDASAATRV
jgi:hypothetical protein